MEKSDCHTQVILLVFVLAQINLSNQSLFDSSLPQTFQQITAHITHLVNILILLLSTLIISQLFASIHKQCCAILQKVSILSHSMQQVYIVFGRLHFLRNHEWFEPTHIQQKRNGQIECAV